MRIPFFSSLIDTIRSSRASAEKPRSMGVIISTYNNPRWLEKTLWGYLAQRYDHTPVELIIADDGSTEETRKLIDRYRPELQKKLEEGQVKHVWHPDDGFRKCEILNRAIEATKAEYLIFTDQDCIPQPNNLETHYQHAQRGWFVSGGYLKLPLDVSQQITRSDIECGTIFTPQWLGEYCFTSPKKAFKRFAMKFPSPIKNWLTTTSATWNGYGSSCWRDDALFVNGFNEAMKYGGEDREFGERLMNAGLRAKQCRYSLTYLHLDHSRPYEDPAVWERNNAIRQQVRKERIIQTPQGIQQHLADWEAEQR